MPGIHTKVERISSTKSCSGLHIHTPPPYHILPPTQAHNNKKELKKNLSLKIQRPAWHLASGWPQLVEGSVNETLSGVFSLEIVHSTPTPPHLFSLDDFYQVAWVGLTLPLCLSLESWDQPPWELRSARPAWGWMQNGLQTFISLTLWQAREALNSLSQASPQLIGLFSKAALPRWCQIFCQKILGTCEDLFINSWISVLEYSVFQHTHTQTPNPPLPSRPNIGGTC